MVKRKAPKDECDEVKAKRKVSPLWTQIETERLFSLILTHGMNGILNKSTNGATCERKKCEWETITNAFNANPSVKCFHLLFRLVTI